MSQKLQTIEALISRATDEYLARENWEYILDVCDCLNQGGDMYAVFFEMQKMIEYYRKMAIFVLQKRFLSGNQRVQLYCLSVWKMLYVCVGLSNI